MDLKLTTKAQEALSAAVRASAAAGHPHTEPAHLLKALTEQRHGAHFRDRLPRRVGVQGAHAWQP